MTDTTLTLTPASPVRRVRQVEWTEDDAYGFGCSLGHLLIERQPIALPAGPTR